MSALVRADTDDSIASTREGDVNDDNHDATGTSSVEQSAGRKVDHKGTRPSLTDFDGNYDRDFVDALCRQAGSEFFLYGTDSRNVSIAGAGN